MKEIQTYKKFGKKKVAVERKEKKIGNHKTQ
jgi:hypothetical protein